MMKSNGFQPRVRLSYFWGRKSLW